ncbi:aldo-keto reductase family protein [Streptomyces sasae]|uniref:hypothetical protein n=1 Tax=Streptomyces sasae TaxID=1266772 RepID=UPI00293042D0|nr:hypothetical protein [Streptomyces sasae]
MNDEETAVPGHEPGAPAQDTAPDDVGGPSSAASPGCGTVVLSRVRGSCRDALRGYAVLIDDTQVGSIGRGQTLRFEVSPGAHRLQLKIAWCTSRPLTASVEEGRTAWFICSPGDDASEGLDAVGANREDYITLQQTSGPIVMAKTSMDRGTRLLVATAFGSFAGGIALIGALIWHYTGLAPKAANTFAGASLAVALTSVIAFRLGRRKAGRHPHK